MAPPTNNNNTNIYINKSINKKAVPGGSGAYKYGHHREAESWSGSQHQCLTWHHINAGPLHSSVGVLECGLPNKRSQAKG